MGNEYIDLKGILALELPNLTRRLPTLRKMAQELGWPYRKRQGRGGGVEYQVAGLPETIQTAVRERQAATLLAKVPVLPAEVKKPLRQNKKMRQLGLIPCEEGLARLDDRQTETAHARCAIVAHVLPLHELAGMPIKKAVAFVVAEAAAGRLPEDVARLIPLANARNNGERGLSEPTLYRWVRAYRAAPDSMSRLLALAPVKTREKTPLLAIDWLPYFLMFYQRPNKRKRRFRLHRQYEQTAGGGDELAGCAGGHCGRNHGQGRKVRRPDEADQCRARRRNQAGLAGKPKGLGGRYGHRAAGFRPSGIDGIAGIGQQQAGTDPPAGRPGQRGRRGGRLIRIPCRRFGI